MDEPQTRYIDYVPSPGNIKRIGKLHAWLYVASLGLIGRRLDGLDILLLTTKGRRSGRPRTVPLPYFRLDGRTVLVASFGGHSEHPAWFTNLLEQPEVRVQLGSRRWTARARVPEAEERAALWSQLTRAFPRYATYQVRTTRLIPLVIVEPG